MCLDWLGTEDRVGVAAENQTNVTLLVTKEPECVLCDDSKHRCDKNSGVWLRVKSNQELENSEWEHQKL